MSEWAGGFVRAAGGTAVREETGGLADEGTRYMPDLMADTLRQAENGASEVADLKSLTIESM